MAGVQGWVIFDSSLQMASVNITEGACGSLNFSLHEFPVMYGHFLMPCRETNIGARVYTFGVSQPTDSVNVSSLFAQMPSLDDVSLVVAACNGVMACSVVRQDKMVKTWQARFFERVAGDVLIRQNMGETSARVLSSLVSIQGSASITSINVSFIQSSASDCADLLNQMDQSTLSPVGNLNVGSQDQPVKSRYDVTNFNTAVRFALLKFNGKYTCAMIRTMEGKKVSARVDMKGARGYFSFSQRSPFDVTEIWVNLTNLESQGGPYHVHQFPLPQMMSTGEGLCSNDNVGGHWNPFNMNTSDPAYPKGPGATHDMYEVGDLSSKHGLLTGANDFEASFTDYNLPLFGRNSIVGRSMVIHYPNGSRFVCATIGYPGEVVVGKSVFKSPVVGTILFAQLKANPYSDVSLFLDLSYGDRANSTTMGHNWHIHEYPVSSETDNDPERCKSTGGHWNPFNVDTGGNYSINCRPDNPFACEIGDLAGKHKTLSLRSAVGGVESKYFFTDTASWVSGMNSAIGRSVVIHAANRAGPRIACANITDARLPSARTGPWVGVGTSSGQVQFLQRSPQGPMFINISLTSLAFRAGGYHVHMLPIKNGGDPCSDENVMGHYNPLSVNTAMSPSPGTGSVDQYEIGDISGKFGLLTGLDEKHTLYMDSNLPLSGPNSIVGRSLVIHYTNGSRMQCANISADNNGDGQLLSARATFNDSVNGSLTLTQWTFPDGSYSNVILEVDVRSPLHPELMGASWDIHDGRADEADGQCNGVGGRFDPFAMPAESSSCSSDHPLNCEVGDMTAKHGLVSLAKRELFTDSTLQLAGDFTVVYRSVVLKNQSRNLACADIMPLSPSVQLVFPNVASFSRFDFRSRVSSVLSVGVWRVTILPGELSAVARGKCQQVTILVSGEVSEDRLNALKNDPRMGPFQQSDKCSQKTQNSGQQLFHGRLPVIMTIATAHFLLLWIPL
ncbi:hypothetical protein JZ751_007931 [Albula glossodonta]|uniref:Superoxide dismutase copper/zinc binding domain-containing protein n=1 Tax=Albula glossodonta TaxID=121402 RepID=A0A8T2NYG2_9TELE|nr:hypothetical protein JZ751_007931 [Albula glossodonta]